MHSSIPRTLQSSSLWFWILSVLFLLPLIFSSYFFLSFELPKSLLFKLGTILLLVYWILKHQTTSLITLPHRSVRILLMLICCWEMVTALLGIQPLSSIFGSYPRQQGGLTLLFYISWAFLVLQTYQVNTSFSQFSKLCSIIANILGSISLLEYLGYMSSILPPAEEFLGRAAATLGQPTFLGLLFVLVTPVILFNIFHEKRYNAWWWLSLTGITFSLIGSLLSGSKSAWIALVIELTMICWLQYRHLPFFRKSVTIVSICLLLSVGLLQVIPGRYIKGTPLERIMITHSENIRSGESRLLIWESAVQAVQKSPLVGYGSEVISEALAPYLSKELYQHETLSGMPDRTHNTILDLLINGGIIGLILWICLWCKIGHDVRKYSSIVHSPLPYLFISSIGFIIGSFFGVATTVHYVFLWTFGAILLKEGEQYTEKQYHLSLPIRVIPICILTVGMGYLFIRGYADIQFAQGFKENNYLLMEEAYQRTTEPFYGVHVLGKTIHSPALSSTTQHVITSLQQRAPAFVDVWIFSALFAQYVGNHDDVHTYFERAKEHAPLSPFLWEEWAKYHIHKGETAQAIQKLTHLLSITPPYWEWDATIDQRNAEEQKQHRIFFKENPHFRNNFLLLARAYFEEGNEERALFYLQHAPQDSIDTLSTYGVIYGTKKEYKKAFMYFEKALALDPTNTQMKQNIEVLHTQCKC